MTQETAPRVYGDTIIEPEAPASGAAPPAPVAQVGAEAPIAPPSSARRDIFAQLGLPNSALERLDQAVARSDTTTTDALAALAGTRQQRAGLMERMEGMERPSAPSLEAIPEAPEPSPRDNLRVFGQFLPVLAMLGGAVNRNSATAALRAGAAALRAARENDAQALEQAQEQWRMNVETTLRQNEQSLQQFNAATTLYRTDIDGAMAQLNALAAQEQNPILQAQVAAGDLSAITQLMAARTSAYSAVQSAYAEQEKINLARQQMAQDARLAELEQTGELAGEASQALSRYQAAARNASIVATQIAEADALAQDGGVGVGSLFTWVPGSVPADLAATIETIGANIGFDRLQEMRENSPTGGALGNVTERELQALRSVYGSLAQSQSRAQFRTNLARVRDQYTTSMRNIRAAFMRDYGIDPRTGRPPGQTGTANTPASPGAPAAPAGAPDPLGIR